MTILEIERGNRVCPSCGQKGLALIVDAPKLWPEGKTVQYRCVECAEKEAGEAGDPIYLGPLVEPLSKLYALGRERNWLWIGKSGKPRPLAGGGARALEAEVHGKYGAEKRPLGSG